MATDLQTRNSLGDTDSINLEESRAILRRLKDEAPLTDNEHVPEPIAPPPSGAENSSNRPQSPQLSGPASRNAPPPPKLSLRLVRPTEIASKPRMGPYISFTKQISEKFPQLAVISAVPEYESPLNVGVIDILPNNRFRCKTFTDHCEPMVEWKSNFSGKELELLEFLRQDIEEDVRYRLILVEDLSPGVLEILGSTLEVDPEFFAEHLHDSGYSEEHKNRPVKEWNTGGCKKQYVSMQWNRPVCLSKGDLAHAKDQKFGQISRSYQELFAVPIEEQIGSEDLLNIVGWDERVSVWDSEDRYCIVLLDPVPTTIQTEIKITKVPLTQEIVDEYDKKKVPQFMRKKYETRREKIYHPNPFYPLPCRQRNVASVLPKFSDFDFESRDGTFAKELLSHNRKSTMEIFLKWIETPPFADMPTNLSAYTHCLLFLLIIIQRDKTELIYQMGKEIEIINSQLPLDFVVQRRVFYWRMLLVLFRERLQITMRMVDSSLTILESLQATETAEENSSPQMGIPRIPSIGIKAAVGSVSSRMPTFRSTASPRIAGALRELSGEFIVLEQQTIWLSERVEQTLQSLMSTLSIIESQRAISEAESVTKLTELAFFFIPLSFSATLFGMQIQEFENRVPIAFWVGVAILITASSYGLRFATRSFLMSQLKRRLVESVRNHAGLRREEVRIPNRAFFVWLLSVLKPPSELISSFLVGGGGGVLLIIVISLLWIKGALLNTVFKVALTVLLLGMFTLAMAAVLTPRFMSLYLSAHMKVQGGSSILSGDGSESTAQYPTYFIPTHKRPAFWDTNSTLLVAEAISLLVAVLPSVLLWILGAYLAFGLKVCFTLVFCTPAVFRIFRRLQQRNTGVDLEATGNLMKKRLHLKRLRLNFQPWLTKKSKFILEVVFIGVTLPIVSTVLMWVLGDYLDFGLKVGFSLVIWTPTVFWLVWRLLQFRNYQGFLTYLATDDVPTRATTPEVTGSTTSEVIEVTNAEMVETGSVPKRLTTGPKFNLRTWSTKKLNLRVWSAKWLKFILEIVVIGVVLPVVPTVLLWALGGYLALGLKVGFSMVIWTPTVFWLVRRWIQFRNHEGPLAHLANDKAPTRVPTPEVTQASNASAASDPQIETLGIRSIEV